MSHQTPDDEILTAMLEFVQDAGVLALSYQAEGLDFRYKGNDLGQALTKADEHLSMMMCNRFGPCLIEEETADLLTKAEAVSMLETDNWTFIGDPIDGTAPYVARLPGWGTMIAACRSGWPRASVMILPAWVEERDRLGHPEPARQRGLLLAAASGTAYWAPTVGGRMVADLTRLEASMRTTRHFGWLPMAAKYYSLDYTQGCFPLSESGYVADAASLAMGRTDATTFNSKLWDLAPSMPILEALGFKLFCWPELQPPPLNIADMFGEDFTCHPALWLIARNKDEAFRLGKAIALCH